MTVPLKPIDDLISQAIDTTILQEALQRLANNIEARRVIEDLIAEAKEIEYPHLYGGIYLSYERADEIKKRLTMPLIHPNDVGLCPLEGQQGIVNTNMRLMDLISGFLKG